MSHQSTVYEPASIFIIRTHLKIRIMDWLDTSFVCQQTYVNIVESKSWYDIE